MSINTFFCTRIVEGYDIFFKKDSSSQNNMQYQKQHEAFQVDFAIYFAKVGKSIRFGRILLLAKKLTSKTPTTAVKPTLKNVGMIVP